MSKFHFFLFTILYLFIDINKSTDAQSFTSISTNITGTIFSSSSWGDYDNDGDLDLIVAGSTTSSMSFDYSTKLYRNDGIAGFVSVSTSIIGINQGSVEWGDYDNDGDLDVLITGSTQSNPITKIYENKGGIFTELNVQLTGATSSFASWGDYDNDGFLDFILIGENANVPNWYVTQIYHNNRNNTFTAITPSFADIDNTYGDGSLAWGDYDNDGDLDIIIAGGTYHGSKTSIYRNDGNGTFKEINAGLIGVYQSSVAWGDYDGDGDLDILLGGNGVIGFYSKIYRNDGNNIFTDINAGLTGLTECSIAWGDYDNDGDLDALIAGYDGNGNDHRSTKIYRNKGNDLFSEDAGLNLEGVSVSTVTWSDYDNDGDLDIFISGSNNSYLPSSYIYRNDAVVKNTVPTTPTGLTSTVINNSVTFKWDKATDDQTSQNGLSYAIYIGKSEHDVQLFSPHSNILTGYRKIVKLGNAGKNTSWTIKNLPNGTYYWCVQSIDNSFAGSPFCSSSNTFTIGDGKPDDGTTGEVETEIFIPNLVTNNGDEKNDAFTLIGFGPQTKLSIYNQWGSIVYSNNDYRNDWNGKNLSSGIYFYVIEDSSRTKKWNGWVQLIK